MSKKKHIVEIGRDGCSCHTLEIEITDAYASAIRSLAKKLVRVESLYYIQIDRADRRTKPV